MVRVYLVTSNRHKLNEITKILNEFDINVEPLNLRKLEIQEKDVSRVVEAAARFLSNCTDLRPLLIEDSGLYIEYLKGFPGAFSKYVYETIGLEGVLKLMKNTSNRSAFFKTAAACVCRTGSRDEIIVREGIVNGKIAEEIRGSRGFGYDPIFVPEGYDRTFGEMMEEEKNTISHRARAIKSIANEILRRYPGIQSAPGS